MALVSAGISYDTLHMYGAGLSEAGAWHDPAATLQQDLIELLLLAWWQCRQPAYPGAVYTYTWSCLSEAIGSTLRRFSSRIWSSSSCLRRRSSCSRRFASSSAAFSISSCRATCTHVRPASACHTLLPIQQIRRIKEQRALLHLELLHCLRIRYPAPGYGGVNLHNE